MIANPAPAVISNSRREMGMHDGYMDIKLSSN